MGVINHNAIIAICDTKTASKAYKWIYNLKGTSFIDLFTVTHISHNNYVTIIMNPDGSKEGWEYSNQCDELRKRFIEEVLNKGNFEWVEVGFGEYGQKVLQGNCKNLYDDREYYER